MSFVKYLKESTNLESGKLEKGWYVENMNDKLVAGPFDKESEAISACKKKGGDEKGFSVTYVSDFEVHRSKG